MVETLRRPPFRALRGSNSFGRDGVCLMLIAGLGLALSFGNGGVVAIALIATACAVALVSPIAAVSAVAAATPFIYRPVALRGGEWSLLELSIGVAAIGVGFHVAWELLRLRSVQPILAFARPIAISLAALMLVVVAAFSLLTVVDQRYLANSIREFRWVILEPLLAFLLFRWVCGVPSGRRMLLISLIGMATIVAAVGLIQVVTQTGVVIADGVERATGPYRHPNNLALYLDRTAILTLGLALSARFNRKLLIGCALACGLGLAATLSRGAALAYIAGACWVVSAARVKRGWRWIAVGIGASGLLLGVIGAERLTDTGSAGTTSSRSLIWSSSIDMIRDHPWTGVGLDQFVNQYGRRYVDPAGWPERYTSHPHNIVLDIWLRLGMAGLATFALIAATIVIIARGPIVEGDRGVWIGATGALLAGSVHGLVDNGYFLPDLAVLTWLMIALIESTTLRSPIAIGTLSD